MKTLNSFESLSEVRNNFKKVVVKKSERLTKHTKVLIKK